MAKLAPLVSIQKKRLKTHLSYALVDTRPVHQSALHRAIRQTGHFTIYKARSDHELATISLPNPCAVSSGSVR